MIGVDLEVVTQERNLRRVAGSRTALLSILMPMMFADIPGSCRLFLGQPLSHETRCLH